jgi:hypothetical protein
MHKSLTTKSAIKLNLIRFALSTAAIAGPAAFVHAADAKPSPLSELSLTLKESYDSNIFGTSQNPTLAGLPQLADVSSWITTLSPKIGLNLKSALDLPADSSIAALSLTYSGDYAFYHSAPTESNQRHNLSQQLKTKADATTFSLDNSFVYVDGRSATTQYGNTSAYGTGTTRERKEQFQDRAKLVLRYDSDVWFARAVGSLLYYDLHTQQHQATGVYTGWQNYADRSDINGGGDLGYKASKDLSLWAGYRYGQQKQSSFAWDLRHNDSNYNRALLGVEGKLASWLKVDAQIGPDFRTYTDTAHSGITGDKHTWLYSEANATADLSKDDSLVFTNKVWHWVSSTGLTAYRDSAYALTYTHKFSSAFSANAGLRTLGSDYDAPATRKDWLDTYSFGARYAFTSKLSLAADYAHTHARNRLSDVTYPGREFSQDQVSLALRLAY